MDQPIVHFLYKMIIVLWTSGTGRNTIEVSPIWKICRHGNTRTLSPFTNSSKQIAHSTWRSNHFFAALHCEEDRGREGIADDSGTTVPESVVVSGGDLGSDGLCCSVSTACSPFSSSRTVSWPSQTDHGKFWTTSSGARSRRAARAARHRWMRSVSSVRIDGRKRRSRNVRIGLIKKCYTQKKCFTNRKPATYEYHCHPVTSIVKTTETVLNPHVEVLEEDIKEESER